MVDKITVNPGEVRGAGNIVSPKSLSDFSCYVSKLSAYTESVHGADMTVYTEQYLQGTYFNDYYIQHRFIPYTGQESFNIPIGLIISDTSDYISGATVKCYVNNVLLSTDTTDSSGWVEFTIPISESVNVYNLKFTYDGDANNAGCFLSKRIVVGVAEDLDLIAERDVIQIGETDQLLVTLSGVGVDGESIGISGQSVSLYELWNPGLKVSAPGVIQSSDVASVHVQLIDTVDGSLVRESGHTINLYEEWTPGLRVSAPRVLGSGDDADFYGQLVDSSDGSLVRESGRTVHFYVRPKYWSPALDGSENVVSWSSLDNYTSNGIFRTHGGYLDDGWSNDGLWELSFDYRYRTSGGPYIMYVGLMPICSSDINPFTDEKNVNYAITTWEGGFSFSGLGRQDWIESPSTTPSVTQTDWNHLQIVKLSSTRLRIVLNSTYTWIGEFPNLVNLDTLFIGSRDNPSSRDVGSYVEYKDIKIKE